MVHEKESMKQNTVACEGILDHQFCYSSDRSHERSIQNCRNRKSFEFGMELEFILKKIFYDSEIIRTMNNNDKGPLMV